MRYIRSLHWIVPILLLALVAGGMTGCSEEAVSPESEQPMAPAIGVSGPVATMIEGDVGPGSKYALCVPDNWNGDLIVYAHGFVDMAMPVVLPTTNDDWEAIRDALLAQGYGVAYSSFSCNGFAIKEGARQTHQVRGLFKERFGQPGHTYLMGHSLGGAISILLAEKHPRLYDGVLSMSGMIGGSGAQLDYVANVRILFDFCYPGVLPGSVVDIPEGIDLYNDVVIPVATAIQMDPDCALAITQFDQTPIPFTNGEQLVESFAWVLGYNFRGFADVIDRTHNHCPVDNTGTVYSCSAGTLPPELIAAVNAMVPRYGRTPDGNAYLRHYVEPTGNVTIPVVTLHSALDPVVPVFHEVMYGELVAEKGKSDNVVQRTVWQYGHGSYAPDPVASRAVVMTAFMDLVNWVENGVRPTP